MTSPQPMPTPDVTVFGRFQGQEVHRITLRSATGLCAQVLTWGAVLQDLAVPMPDGTMLSATLGFRTFAPYPAHSPYFGAIVGRYANRIGNGRFNLNGRTHLLDRNERGRTTLHGGTGGFSQRLWRILEADSGSVTLGLTSHDGDQGFPGTVTVACRYRLAPGNRMSIDYTAQTDAPTPLNLTHHSYFNLDGGSTLADHRLLVHADRYTPIDENKIPTGIMAPVAGSAFDFRCASPLMNRNVSLDHNFVLRPAPGGAVRPAAELGSAKSGLRMRIATTKPGLQVYDGHQLSGGHAGREGGPYAPFAGLCLEPQFFPDSPNIASFPDSTLFPGEVYQHKTVYTFDQH